MALTLSILRLCPLYLRYEYCKAEVYLEWDKPNNSVVLHYKHHGILCYSVQAKVYKEDNKAKTKLEIVPIRSHDVLEKEVLKNYKVMTDFYQLMGVITRTVWQNNADLDDTDKSAVRNF